MNKQELHHKEAVIYARTAVVHNEDIAVQIDNCRAYANDAGYDVRATFADNGMSGAQTDRPGLTEMLDCLACCEKPTVIVQDRARLTRDLGNFLALKRKIDRFGGRIEYVDGPNTGNTPEGCLIEVVAVARAQRDGDGSLLDE